MCCVCRTLVSILHISSSSLQLFLCFQLSKFLIWMIWSILVTPGSHNPLCKLKRSSLVVVESHTLKLHFLCWGNMFHKWMRKDSFCDAITGVNCGSNACRNLCLTITHGLYCINWSNCTFHATYMTYCFFIIFWKLSPLCLVLGCLSLSYLCIVTLYSHKWYGHVSTALSVHQICISLPMFLSWWGML